MTSEELKAKIKEEVDSAWKKRQPVLLSYLGALDSGEIASTAKRESGTLTGFIREHLGEDVELIKHSSISAAVGAIPKKRETGDDEDADKLLEARLRAAKGEHAKIQFNRRFWTAFRKPLELGLKRYVEVDGLFGFRNVDEKEKPPEGSIEVHRDFIAKGDETPDEDVYKNIESWASNNGLSVEDFAFKAGMVRSVRSQTGWDRKDSILDYLLSALDLHDLRRIEMPLDIILKLKNSKP